MSNRDGCPVCSQEKRTNTWKSKENEIFEKVKQTRLKNGIRSIGEINVENWLVSNNITFTSEYMSNIKYEYNFEGKLRKAIIDFTDIYYNGKTYWIEVNGAQHYKYSKLFHYGDLNNFYKQLTRDDAVRNYCKDNNIVLIEVPYTLVRKSEKVNNFLNKTIIEGIDPNTLIDYKKLYKT